MLSAAAKNVRYEVVVAAFFLNVEITKAAAYLWWLTLKQLADRTAHVGGLTPQ